MFMPNVKILRVPKRAAGRLCGAVPDRPYPHERYHNQSAAVAALETGQMAPGQRLERRKL